MKNPRIIIIGGLSAGPSAAAKARRVNENAEILLFEKTANISYATCGIPYALSGKINSRDKLMVVKPNLLENRFGVEMHLNEPVIDINPTEKTVKTPKGVYNYDKLVFATGGRAVVPPVENLLDFTNWSHIKTIEDFDRIMKAEVIREAEHFTIVGAGLIGLETAENLIHIGKKVTVVEFADQILTPWDKKFAEMGKKALEAKGVEVRTGVGLSSVNPENNELTLSNGDKISTDYVLIGTGVKPNTELLTAKGAEHLPNGALLVNDKMETSLSDIYAAGDCASIPNLVSYKAGWFPMGTHSNKGGRAAGANAAGGNETFEGGYGTAIMQMFDYTIARTGMGAKALKAAGMSFQSTMIIAGTTPGFYPDQKDIFIEVYYNPETKELYGAELFGEKGVDKRVDVLATAVYAKLKITDLPKLDLAYAPPFSPAKDPVVVAGYVAENSCKNNYTEVSVLEVKNIVENNIADNATILDVRTEKEVQHSGSIKGAVNIPLDELRGRLHELEASKEVYVYCAKGLRGYLASLILTHNGFKYVNNMAGGFTAWNKIVGEVVRLEEAMV